MSILPARKGPRYAVYAAVVLAYATTLWIWVFPWLDRTFVNRPALG